MTTDRIIYCIFLKKHAIGLPTPCYPGTLGKHIYNNISKEAWLRWQNRQTILINEKRLNMLKTEDRLILEKEMKNFLFNTV